MYFGFVGDVLLLLFWDFLWNFLFCGNDLKVGEVKLLDICFFLIFFCVMWIIVKVVFFFFIVLLYLLLELNLEEILDNFLIEGLGLLGMLEEIWLLVW